MITKVANNSSVILKSIQANEVALEEIQPASFCFGDSFGSGSAKGRALLIFSAS